MMNAKELGVGMLVSLGACGLPWTPPQAHPRGAHVSVGAARNATYGISSLDGAHRGAAFVVDHHHLLTVTDLCDGASAWLLAPQHAVTVSAMDSRWCLLEAMEDMGPGLALTRDAVRMEAYPRMRAINGDLSVVIPHREEAHWVATHADTGAPVVMQWGAHTGVAGVVLADDHVSSVGLRDFLWRHGVNWTVESSLCEDVDCSLGESPSAP